jgi:2-succinyl-6-hydroxy-2,4-cyclohexadiene-1-carboxylate synthase
VITDLTRRFSVDDVSLAWDRWGADDSTPLFLCHGFSGSSHDFALHGESLAASRTVMMADHRGHGRSQKLGTTAGYSIDRLAFDLIGLLDAEVGRPVDLLGHSMGGAISLRVTLARPDLVRSLILMDTSGWSFVPPDAEVAAMMTAFIEGFDPAGGLPDLTAWSGPEEPLIAATTPAEWQVMKEQMAAAFDPYAMKALGRELFEHGTTTVRDRLGEIACPVTVIVGEHDQPFVDQAPELAAEVADGVLTVIGGAYHSPQLTHPTEWSAAVGAHLARVDG